MNKLTKLMLASAMMITSGFAESEGSSEINAYLYAGGGLKIEINKTVGSAGVVDMGSACIQMSEGCELSNHGKIDISGVTDFSGYKGTVNGSTGSVVVVPRKDKVSTALTGGGFEFKGAYELKYNSDSYFCDVSSGVIESKKDAGYVYSDVSAVQTALGLTFSDNPELTDTAVFTLKDLVSDGVNIASNVECTYDISDANLDNTKLELEAEATMNFGLVSAAASTMEVKGGKLTIAGNCSGMLGKIKTNRDLEFKGVGSKGALEVEGMLSYVNEGSETIETICTGEIKAGDLKLDGNVVLKCSELLTIGWSEPVFLRQDGKTWYAGCHYCYELNGDAYGLYPTSDTEWNFVKGTWDAGVFGTFTVDVSFSSNDIGVSCDTSTGELTYGKLETADITMTGPSVNFIRGTITYKEVADVFRAIKDGTATYLGSIG